MRAKRVDSTLMEIVETARDLGMLVFVRNDALADLDIQYRGISELWEVKTPKGTFTETQERNRAKGWKIRTVRSVDDVIKARREMG